MAQFKPVGVQFLSLFLPRRLLRAIVLTISLVAITSLFLSSQHQQQVLRVERLDLSYDPEIHDQGTCI